MNTWLGVEKVSAMFAAAPVLQVLNAQVTDGFTPLLPVLRNDPPYGPLRISQLCIHFLGRQLASAADDVRTVAAFVTASESLKGLTLADARFAPGLLNELIDLVTERRLSRLAVDRSILNADTISAFARLLQRGTLTRLDVGCEGFPPAQDESMPVLCAALRACPTLTSLTLRLKPLNGANRRAVTDLLDAAATLPALSELDLSGSVFQDTVDAGRALGAFLAANPPSLRILRVAGCGLGDEGQASILEGFAINTHLHTLDCRGNDDE